VMSFALERIVRVMLDLAEQKNRQKLGDTVRRRYFRRDFRGPTQ
jgi:hypothetical protein